MAEKKKEQVVANESTEKKANSNRIWLNGILPDFVKDATKKDGDKRVKDPTHKNVFIFESDGKEGNGSGFMFKVSSNQVVDSKSSDKKNVALYRSFEKDEEGNFVLDEAGEKIEKTIYVRKTPEVDGGSWGEDRMTPTKIAEIYEKSLEARREYAATNAKEVAEPKSKMVFLNLLQKDADRMAKDIQEIKEKADGKGKVRVDFVKDGLHGSLYTAQRNVHADKKNVTLMSDSEYNVRMQTEPNQEIGDWKSTKMSGQDIADAYNKGADEARKYAIEASKAAAAAKVAEAPEIDGDELEV